MNDRWIIREDTYGELTVSGPALGVEVDHVEVERAAVQTEELVNRRTVENEIRDRALVAKFNHSGKIFRDGARQVRVVRQTDAGEEGGTGGYHVVVKEAGKRDDPCVFQAAWLEDLEVVYDSEWVCICGHTMHWHGQDDLFARGTGECDSCDCKKFARSR